MKRLLASLVLMVACDPKSSPPPGGGTTPPGTTPTGNPGPSCDIPYGTCDAGVCGTDLSSDPVNCGVCGNKCSETCEMGECTESRARRHRLSMTFGGACVIRSGQVWCWTPDAATGAGEAALVYGDDAEQVVLHGNDYAILRTDGSVTFVLRQVLVEYWTQPSWTSRVRDLGTNGTGFLVGQQDDGLLLWHDSTVLGATIDNPPLHVARVGGGYPDAACWQIQGREVWCLSGQTAFVETELPVRDWSIGVYFSAGIDGDGNVVGLGGTADPVPFGIGDAVQLGAGHNLGCALRGDGKVQCFDAPAWNSATDLGVVEGIDDAVAVAAGGFAGCAVRADDSVACWVLGQTPLQATDVTFL